MAEKDELHKAHRSGWSKYYETTAPQPQHFLPPAEEKPKRKPPPPPKKKTPVDEFMSVTGVDDAAIAAQHVDAAFRLGESVEDAIRKYFEYPPAPAPSLGIAARLMDIGFARDLAELAETECQSMEEAAEWCLRRQHEERQAKDDQLRQEQQRQAEERRLAAEQRQAEERRRAAEQREQQERQRRAADLALQKQQEQQLAALAFRPPEPPKLPTPPPAYRPPSGAALFGQPPPASLPPPPPPPPYSQKPTLLTDEDLGLFITPKETQKKAPAPKTTRNVNPSDILNQSSIIGKRETPTIRPDDTPVVVATNPYGHAPMAVMSMPPTGVLGGAEAARGARTEAAKATMGGKLWKMSGISSGKASRLGSRWQARHFVLSQSTIGYGDVSAEGGLRASTSWSDSFGTDEFSGTKKRFSLFGSYVVPEPPERAQGREFAFAVYRSDADAFAGATGKGTSHIIDDEREQLLLLAAEDEKTRAKWICVLLRAAGRGGVLLRVGQDAGAYRLRCCFGDEAFETEIGVVTVKSHGVVQQKIKKVLVRHSEVSHGLGAVGVKVGDELVAVNGTAVPGWSASVVSKMLESCSRPLELEFRRARDPVAFEELAAAAILARGTDEESDTVLKQRLRESMDVGAALRADKKTREELRAKRAAEAKADALKTAEAIHKSRPSPEQERIEHAVSQVLAAVTASADADDFFYGDHIDFGSAAKLYKIALEALLSVKDDLADPNSPARAAVARKAPNVSLADLFDHINANGAKAADNVVNGVTDNNPRAAGLHYEAQPPMMQNNNGYDDPYNNNNGHVSPYEQQQQGDPYGNGHSPSYENYEGSGPYNNNTDVHAVTQQLEHQHLVDQQQQNLYTTPSSDSSEPQQQYAAAAEEQKYAVALFAYEAQDEWQLGIQPGDRLVVFSQHDDGWADVLDEENRRGLIPSSYIQTTS